jgi:threonine/homoserine/homoserine lactone efflux protein
MTPETDTIFYFMSTGILLGLSGGLSPGPLTALVISQTLRFGAREGMLVALAPILTDAPLVIAAGLLVTAVAGMNTVLGVLSVLGALVVTYLAWDAYHAQIPEVEETGEPRSIVKSIAVNLVNPHPYVFWLMVGGPLVASALDKGGTHLVCFLAGFFGCLVGAKLALALITQHFREWLMGPPYRMVMRGLAIALFAFASVMFIDGVEKLWA